MHMCIKNISIGYKNKNNSNLFTVYKSRVPNTVARRVSSSVAMVTTLPAVVSMVVLVSMVAVAMVGMTVILQPRLK